MKGIYHPSAGSAGPAALALAASLPLFATPGPARAQAEAERLLRRVAHASDDDLSLLAAGTPFIRSVEGDTRREMMLVVAVRVRAPVAFVLDRIREEHLLVDDAEGPGARGEFSDPPALADLAGLELGSSDIRYLKKCRPGDCGLKLSAAAIDRLEHDVDFSARTARDDANRFFRRELLAQVAAYSARGDAAAPVYADKQAPLDVAEGLERLLDRSDYLEDLDPDLHRHLLAYPGEGASADEGAPDMERAAEIEDSFSWTVEDLGVKTIVSLNHVAVKPLSPSGAALIAVRRVYADHYFQAGLRVLVLTPPTGDRAAPDTYVTVITRLRFDGELVGIRRIAMERRLERNAETVLAAVRDRIETQYGQR